MKITGLPPLALLFSAGLLLSTTAQAAPNFKAPFPCNHTYHYYHHGSEVRQALDFNAPHGVPVLASAAGTASLHNQPSGAGQYIILSHGDGWTTYYFHLDSYSVSNGAQVSQGQQIGTTGNTGNSFGAHIHYEQLRHGVGQVIHINGQSLAPYPSSSAAGKTLTSDNGCGTPPSGSTPHQYWVSTWADANGRDAPGGTITGTLYAGTHYVYCKAQGPNIQLNGLNNHWWLKTDLDTGQYNQWISAALLNNSSDHQARDNNGNRIPQCDLLPHGAIGERYNELGNNAGLLGAPVQPEADAQQGGRYQRFENGIILWHPDTGAQPIHGQILAHFEATGVEGHWGFPVTAEADAAPSPKTGNPGRYQYFEHAHGPRLLLWTATTGAFGLHGAIHDHFANNGRETVFGYPTGDEQPHGDGVKQEFELYTFYWTPQQGVWTTSK